MFHGRVILLVPIIQRKEMEKLERINKYLGEAGVCSRRDVDALIESGRVEVNGLLARIGMQIDTERDIVTVDGQKVDPSNPLANAISKDVILEQMERTPWWVEHNQIREERDASLKMNPKSKLLRSGKKNNGSKSKKLGKNATLAQQMAIKKKSLSQLRDEVAHAEAIKTRGHSSQDKQAKNEAVQAANKALTLKQEHVAEVKKAKSFNDVFGNDKQALMNVKTRRVEGVNSKAKSQRTGASKKKGSVKRGGRR